MKLSNAGVAVETIESILKRDPLNHLARYTYFKLSKLTEAAFYSALCSDASQTCLDLAFNFKACGMGDWATELLNGISNKSPMVYYALGDLESAEKTPLNSSFPFRPEEYKLLKRIIEENQNLGMAQYYYGCLRYATRQYECAAAHFKKAIELKPDFYIPYRNLAIAYFSHLNKKEEALPLLKKALELHPKNKQLVYEIVLVMGKLGVAASERIDFILSNTDGAMRDDICIELARAYNQNGEHEKTIELFSFYKSYFRMYHRFCTCFILPLVGENNALPYGFARCVRQCD